MTLYLVRHGRAVSERVDPKRPLSAEGRAEAERVGAHLARIGVRVDRVVHSGVPRAAQTAEILARQLGIAEGALAPHPGLLPEDPPAPAARWLRDALTADASIMVVGHLPFIDRLAALLVTGAQDGHLIDFETASVARLTRGPGHADFLIAWVLRPDCI